MLLKFYFCIYFTNFEIYPHSFNKEAGKRANAGLHMDHLQINLSVRDHFTCDQQQKHYLGPP